MADVAKETHPTPVSELTHEPPTTRKPVARRRKYNFDNPDKLREANARKEALRKAPASSSIPADFIGHLPQLNSASRILLPRILSNEVEFRSSILDRIRFMEQHIVQAITKGLYDVEKSSLPTLIREWRQCLELSLRIVEKTKGLNTDDAGVNQVSGLLAKEAILRHELERLSVLDSSGRIIRTQEHEQAEDAQPAESDPPPPPTAAAADSKGGI